MGRDGKPAGLDPRGPYNSLIPGLECLAPYQACGGIKVLRVPYSKRPLVDAAFRFLTTEPVGSTSAVLSPEGVRDGTQKRDPLDESSLRINVLCAQSRSASVIGRRIHVEMQWSSRVLKRALFVPTWRACRCTSGSVPMRSS